MEQYQDFAYVYDRLMEDVDYEAWVAYILEIFNRSKMNPKRILELACGTGNITLPMTKRGYEVIAMDLSEEMLMVARDKALNQGVSPLLIQQDMTNLELEGEFDAVICMCDGVNYILDRDDLLNTFKNVKEHLSKDGVFLFDISSHYKLRYILGENTYGENQGDLCYLWENYFDEDTNLLEMSLTFFIEEKNLYRKFEEFHQQRAYYNEELLQLLEEAGFKEIQIFDAFNFSKPKKDSERVFFLCR